MAPIKLKLKVSPKKRDAAASAAPEDAPEVAVAHRTRASTRTAATSIPTPPADTPSSTMAPVSQTPHDVVENQIKDVIQDFYQMMVQVSAYDLAQGRSSRDVLENSVKHLEQALQTLSTTSQAQPLPGVPAELIQYVDNGRNPDIYTREFVELARRGNQLMKGKMEAFASFRDVLAGEMVSALPELREDIASVVGSTGGKRETVVKTESES